MERIFKITVDGREYQVTVEELTESASVVLPDPGSMQIPRTTAPAAPLAAPAASAPAVADAGPGDEVSPLAGVVHSVDVSVGQEVKEGDQIASIEAMKMTTKVIAHHAGKVSRIEVKPGDAVDAGQVLLNIS